MSVSFPSFFGPKDHITWSDEELNVLRRSYLYHQRFATSTADLESKMLADPHMADIIHRRYNNKDLQSSNYANNWRNLLKRKFPGEDFKQLGARRRIPPTNYSIEQLRGFQADISSAPNNLFSNPNMNPSHKRRYIERLMARAHSSTQAPIPAPTPAPEQDDDLQIFMGQMLPHLPSDAEGGTEDHHAEMRRQLYEKPVSQKLAVPFPFDLADAAEDDVQGFSDDNI